MNIKIQLLLLFVFYIFGGIIAFVYSLFGFKKINYHKLYIINPLLLLIMLSIIYCFNYGVLHVYFFFILILSIIINYMTVNHVIKSLKNGTKK